MTCVVQNNEPMAIVNGMDSYFKHTPPDCSLFSQDYYEISIHKEVLFQTKYMQELLKSVNLGTSFSKTEIIFDSVDKDELKMFVQFLYTGQISCNDQAFASQVSNNLTKLLGFPSLNFSPGAMDFVGYHHKIILHSAALEAKTTLINNFQDTKARKKPRKQALTTKLADCELTETVIKKEIHDSDEVNGIAHSPSQEFCNNF